MVFVQLIPHRTRPFNDLDGPGRPLPPPKRWGWVATVMAVFLMGALLALVGLVLPPEPSQIPGPSPEEVRQIVQELHQTQAQADKIRAEMAHIKRETRR